MAGDMNMMLETANQMAREPAPKPKPQRYARFEDWYTLDITLRGSPRPIARAAWEAGLAEGIARGRESTGKEG